MENIINQSLTKILERRTNHAKERRLLPRGSVKNLINCLRTPVYSRTTVLVSPSFNQTGTREYAQLFKNNCLTF
jgi:hypothetical protein